MCRGVEHRECVALLHVRDKHGASVRCVKKHRHLGGVSILDANAETQEPAEMNDFGEEAPVADRALVARLARRELRERWECGRVAEVGRMCCGTCGSARVCAVTWAVSRDRYGEARKDSTGAVAREMGYSDGPVWRAGAVEVRRC